MTRKQFSKSVVAIRALNDRNSERMKIIERKIALALAHDKRLSPSPPASLVRAGHKAE